MTTTHVLERRQHIERPLAEVFPFFADAGNLEAITPEFLHFRILTPQPIVMAAGALIDYQIRLFGVPLNWRTRIEEYDPPHRFVDVQVRGPYKLWHHTHEFHEENDGVTILDRVRYQLPLGPLGSVAHAFFVRRTLAANFDYRLETIDRLIGKSAVGADRWAAP